jgi:hypothetical protein
LELRQQHHSRHSIKVLHNKGDGERADGMRRIIKIQLSHQVILLITKLAMGLQELPESQMILMS